MKDSIPQPYRGFQVLKEPHVASGYHIGKHRYRMCLSLQKILLDNSGQIHISALSLAISMSI